MKQRRLAVVLVACLGLATAFPVAAATAQGADSVVFVPSDVARLAATGRPQLVEFYHPG